MRLIDYIKEKMLKQTGLTKGSGNDDDRLTLINNEDELAKLKLTEYNIWYEGDGDELLNFYTRQDMYAFNCEPMYMRNKRNYFWALSAEEAQIKRTHSGQPRNIVDTLVSIMPFPIIDCNKLGHDKIQANLDAILKENGLANIYMNEQMPLSLVEGWGCYKINIDTEFSSNPIIQYYRASNVDFVYRCGRITGIIFKDYYKDKDNKEYVLVESRNIEVRDSARSLVIKSELFEKPTRSDDNMRQVDLSTVAELSGIEPEVVIGPFEKLLAVPVILLSNTANTKGYGRSIFTGKIDLFDDLDQCLSQASNAVRLSTPVEYFNSEYLERDRNGMPKKPSSYDRKYIMMDGGRNADGESTGAPLEISQPNINFDAYSNQAVQIMLQIINGIMSPATLGIDIAKKDNAAAQREKEKVTIFTRNTIISKEILILKDLCSQLLCAKELIDKDEITVHDYDVTVKYNEFADDSYENKLDVLGRALDLENMSPDMYMSKLYGDTLSREDYEKERSWIEERRLEKSNAQNAGMAGIGGDDGVNLLGMDEDEI